MTPFKCSITLPQEMETAPKPYCIFKFSQITTSHSALNTVNLLQGKSKGNNTHICDLAPQNELKVAKYSLLVIPTKVACLLTYSLKDAGFV